MKRLIVSILPLLVGCALSAQTYHDGVWYSIYDDATHTMNTQGDYETGDIFAPTSGSLTVQWRYEYIIIGLFKHVNTEVLTSANGGSSTSQIGKLTENTGNNSNTTDKFTVDRNINWLKFNRPDDDGLSGPTHKVHVYHIDIPLAKHILLASGDYGTDVSAHDFGEQDALSTSEPYMVNLRSFLSAGDITITSSNPEIFHLGTAENINPIVYAVGANACASVNGTAKTASGSSLGKIENYAIPVYFTPQESGTYGAVITITDGVSKATVALTGKGRKLNQTIAWNPAKTTLLSNETIEPATVSSGLEVTYTFSPEGIVTFADGTLSILKDGEVTITAVQNGNSVYNAAEPVAMTFTIFPAVTYGSYDASICEGDVYADEHFTSLTEERLYYDTIPNVYGGDSVICLALHVHPRFASEETSEHYIGMEGIWQGIDLSLLPEGDTALVATYTSAYGCDSTYVLRLTVIPRPTTYGADTLHVCEGDSVFYQGKKYTEYTEDSVLLVEKNALGGDSIVALAVYVHPVSDSVAEQAIMRGKQMEWQGIDLSLLPEGDTTLVAAYTSAYGCDSTYTLHLKVLPRPVSFGADTLHLCSGEQMVYEGKTYRRPCIDSVLIAEPNSAGGDSIVVLVVYVHPKMCLTLSQTITEGEFQEWQGIDLSQLPVGDTTLIAEYASVYGCDSIYTLQLTVKEKMAESIDVTTIPGKTDVQKVLLNGELYIRRNDQYFDLTGKRRR